MSHSTVETQTDTGSADSDDPCPVEPPSSRYRVDLAMEAAEPTPALSGWLERHLRRVLKAADVERATVSLAVVDDAAMRRLHRQYLDADHTTDVLTFDLREGDDSPLEGEIILCLDEASRQASRRGHEVRLEALLYAVHGLLHLLGYDDHDEAGARQMHAREDELLRHIGVGPIYDRPAARP